jgi:hypothetical protein
MSERISSGNVKARLQALIVDATTIAPLLAKRLDQIRRWIKDKKPGLLASKPYVMDFLHELDRDVRTWLAIQELEPDWSKDLLEQMSASEKYWYIELFPQWINEPDPKLSIWKRKLMAGEYHHDDEDLINDLRDRIDANHGSSWACYILDLSMATDLIASGSLEKPLCVQLTTQQSQYSVEKKEKWELTLRHWKIQRGLFVSFNPVNSRGVLASRLLQESDGLPARGYNEIEM